MKILLTGSTGFIGQNLIEQLFNTNHEIFMVGRNLPYCFDDRFQFFNLDLFDYDATKLLIAKIKPEIAIHLAWNVEHGKYWNSTDNYRCKDATINLLRCLGKTGCTRVFISGTCAEYDWNNQICNENTLNLYQHSIYGTVKNLTRIEAEKLSKDYGFTLIWGRIFFPFGPGESSSRLLPSILNSFKNKITFECRNPYLERDFIYVYDVASAILNLTLNHEANGIFNISSGEPIKIIDLINKCSIFFDRTVRVNYDSLSTLNCEPEVFYGDNSKLLNSGWSRKFTIDEAIADYISYLYKN